MKGFEAVLINLLQSFVFWKPPTIEPVELANLVSQTKSLVKLPASYQLQPCGVAALIHLKLNSTHASRPNIPTRELSDHPLGILY